jgi:hypothetical protein
MRCTDVDPHAKQKISEAKPLYSPEIYAGKLAGKIIKVWKEHKQDIVHSRCVFRVVKIPEILLKLKAIEHDLKKLPNYKPLYDNPNAPDPDIHAPNRAK